MNYNATEARCPTCGWSGPYQKVKQETGGRFVEAWQVWCPDCGTRTVPE